MSVEEAALDQEAVTQHCSCARLDSQPWFQQKICTRRMEIMLALPTPEATLAASERLILFSDHGAARLAARQCALLAQNSFC